MKKLLLFVTMLLTLSLCACAANTHRLPHRT